MHIVIFGAGAIGCYTGGSWCEAVAKAGGRITLVGRKSTLDPVADNGLHLSGPDSIRITPDALAVTDDPQVLCDADLVVLAMKGHALPNAIEVIRAYANTQAPILSLLNGLAPIRTLRNAFPDRDCIAGMVPFNVVWQDQDRLHRTGPGEIAVQSHAATEWLAKAGAAVALHADLTLTQYGKLLLNLANPVNALAGIPLYDMLLDPGYRQVMGQALKEALFVYDGAGIKWAQVGPNNPRLACYMLRAPTWLFKEIVLRKQALDRKSMTSMAEELRAGRLTEIDILSGEIVRLGRTHAIPTPSITPLSAL
jgi:2-dehydropantoate 2-reductase